MVKDCHVIKVDTYDIGNGPGIRVTVWVSGCCHQCPGCHNPKTWKWKQGTPLNNEIIQKILEACNKPFIAGLSLSGGDPLFLKNREGITAICKAFRERFGNSKSIWLWTGFKYEDVKNEEVLQYLDVMIDGKYVDFLKDPSLPYAGSSNQCVINLKELNA